MGTLKAHTRYKGVGAPPASEQNGGAADSTTEKKPHQHHQVVRWLWEVLEVFTPEQRQRFLRFVWGRSRLPTGAEGWTEQFTVCVKKARPSAAAAAAAATSRARGGSGSGPRRTADTAMPQAHTCFNQLDIPEYSSKAVLRERLLYAINNCSSIDTD